MWKGSGNENTRVQLKTKTNNAYVTVIYADM